MEKKLLHIKPIQSVLLFLFLLLVLTHTQIFAQSGDTPFVLRINSGGGQISYGDELFLSDRYYTGNGKSYVNNNVTSIANTTNDAIYLGERSTTQNLGSFGYAIPLDNGKYTIKLHFAEIYWGATGGGPGGSGKRVFDVTIEGSPVLSNYDIFQEAGSMSAVIETFEVDINDGELNLNFSADVNQPKISALEIIGEVVIPDPDPEPKPDPGPNPKDDFVLRINSGGGQLSYGGTVFEADKYYKGDLRTYSNKNVTQINNTTQDELYFTERTTSSDFGEFAYDIPLQDGDYTLKLHFAEIYWGAPGGGSGGTGKRVFSVDLEGDKELVDFDIIKDAGAITAIIKTFDISITDGQLNLRFYSSKNRPKLSAIEIFGSTITEEEDEELPLLTRINSGGGTVNAGGIAFNSDIYYIGDGKPFSNNNIADIKATDQDIVYRTERSTNSDKGSFGYAIPVTNGTYMLKLHFAEIYWGATSGGPGGNRRRVFDVSVEGNPAVINFDINKEVGPMTAVIKEFTTTVDDGELNIDLSASINQPKLSAFELFGDGTILSADPESCEWNDLANSSYERLESQSAKVNGKLYVLAGFVANLKITDATEIYDPVSNSWSEGAPMPIAVTHMGTAVAGNEIWIVAGFVGNHPGTATNKVQVYNTQTNSWRYGPNLPAARGSGTAVYNKGKIHFFGGLLPDRKTDVGEHYVLDLANQNQGWQPAAPLPNPRNHLSSASVDGIVYAIGGQYGHDAGVDDRNNLDAYNPATNSWTRKANLPSERSHFEPGTIVHNGKIIIAGGRRGNYFFDDITQYDPATNIWTELCKLPDPLLAPAAKVFGDKLVIANGGVGGTCCPVNNTRWLYIEPEANSQVAFKAALPEESDTGIVVFPNPTSDAFQIDFGEEPQTFLLTVSNFSGKVVVHRQFKDTVLPVITLDGPSGIYFMHFKFASGDELVRKVVKL